MKTIKYSLILLALLTLSSCASPSVAKMNLDGKIVKDASGNYYIIRYNIGDTFFIEEINNFKEF